MKVLRWIAVLPVSIISLILTYYIYRFGYGLVGENPDALLNRVFMGFICSLAYMYAGISLAPSHKKTTSLILCIIGALLSIYSLFLIFDITNVVSIIVLISVYFSTSENGLG